MNCKPGDLAFVVRTGRGTQHLLGRFVTVHSPRFIADLPDGPGWTYSPPLKNSEGEVLDCLEDGYLRPIRDPGDDAVDEMVRFFPVPGKAVLA